MKFLGAWCVAWAAGLAAYAGSLELFWSQTIPHGNRQALVFWSALSLLVAAAVLHGPAMAIMRRRTSPALPWWAFPVTGLALGIVPLALLIAVFGSGLGALASPEATMYPLFGTFGFVFGLGYVLLHPRREPI